MAYHRICRGQGLVEEDGVGYLALVPHPTISTSIVYLCVSRTPGGDGEPPHIYPHLYTIHIHVYINELYVSTYTCINELYRRHMYLYLYTSIFIFLYLIYYINELYMGRYRMTSLPPVANPWDGKECMI